MSLYHLYTIHMITSTIVTVNYLTSGTSTGSYQNKSKTSLKNKLPAFIRRRIAHRKIAKTLVTNKTRTGNTLRNNEAVFSNGTYSSADNSSYNRIISLFCTIGNIVGTVSIVLMFTLPFFAGIL